MHYIPYIAVTATLITFSTTDNNGKSKLPDTPHLSVTATATTFRDTVHETGKKIFFTHCYNCHKDSAAGLAPGYSALTTMTANSILASLNTGKMQQQAAHLTEGERKAVAQFITNSKLTTTTLPKTAFTPFTIATTATPFDHSGWGNNLPGTGFRNPAQAGISVNNVDSLQLKWAFAFPGVSLMRTKPAVVGDWLLVNGQLGDVYALNRNTGKVGWQFAANAAVRGAISVVRSGNAITAYFADNSTNVYALNVKTGKLIWRQRAGFDPQSSNTGSVVVYNGVIYVPISSLEVASAAYGSYNCCFSSGGVVAMDARTGKRIWMYRIVPKASLIGKNKKGRPMYGPSGAPVWCSPTIDAKRGLLYIGTGENYTHPTTNTSDAIQAIDLKTGKLKWNFQATAKDAYNSGCPFLNNCPDSAGPDLDFGMAPILVKRKDGKEILVAGQKSGVVHALSPDNGRLLWQTRIGKGGMLGGIHWGMATDGNYVYAANSDLIFAVDRRDSTLQPSPGLYALDLHTGKVVWKTPAPDCAGKTGCMTGNSAAPVVAHDLVWAGGLDGHIRAYAAADGKIVWDYNTVKEYETVNGVKGNGGAIDGPPPVISNGMLFVNSGYGLFGQSPGNVLLAFAITNRK
jgi:polyvinyl alcohol dehydrogenase (cytochrome)